MTNIVVKGGLLITPKEERMADVWTLGQRIGGLGAASGLDDKALVVDASGCYVTPGLFDLQVNGGPGCNFWGELKADHVHLFSSQLLKHGVTSILPTIITGAIERTVQNRDFLKSEFGISLAGRKKNIVRMPGIHLEGPCLSPAKPGVHPVEYLQPLTVELLKQIVDSSIKLITLAPELDPSGESLAFLQKNAVNIALGHSNATLAEARSAFAKGVSLITHIFNALPGIHHRNPGAVTAALLDQAITCCLICDGLHVDPAACELVLRMKGSKNTVLVTDIAHIGTSEGGLVGSSIFLDQAVQNVVSWGISNFREAVLMASYNPAKLLGLEAEIGSLQPGAYADLVLWDRQTLAIKKVIFNGQVVEA
ncbi:MAG: amidohydrolase family protein [Candidatus Obscuribacterales bacterium]|nr:amidohydrolase family protein [Candidatus Obscuribacterales bacterium]